MMSNSPLAVHTRISPHRTSPRNARIDTITIHCVAGNLTIESLGAWFANPATKASSNYGVGSDGRVGMYVEEKDRSWCTSSGANDNRAITIEVANTEARHPWPVSDNALEALISLCGDICRRNGIMQLQWSTDKNKPGNMTVHRWFANKACPGDYLYLRHGHIAAEVNKRLKGDEDMALLDEVRKIDGLENVKESDVAAVIGSLMRDTVVHGGVHPSIKDAYKMAVSEGITDGNNPGMPATRAETAVMVRRAFSRLR